MSSRIASAGGSPPRRALMQPALPIVSITQPTGRCKFGISPVCPSPLRNDTLAGKLTQGNLAESVKTASNGADKSGMFHALHLYHKAIRKLTGSPLQRVLMYLRTMALLILQLLPPPTSPSILMVPIVSLCFLAPLAWGTSVVFAPQQALELPIVQELLIVRFSLSRSKTLSFLLRNPSQYFLLLQSHLSSRTMCTLVWQSKRLSKTCHHVKIALARRSRQQTHKEFIHLQLVYSWRSKLIIIQNNLRFR